MMEDDRIIELYFSRSEAAIEVSEQKYGKYCRSIADRILECDEDSEECVNDTWLNAWNSIPPTKPTSLKSFFGALTRNLALNRCDYNNAQKRQSAVQVIDEFWECVPNPDAPLDDELALKHVINAFLEGLDSRTRIIFMRRYWYCLPVSEIADGMELSENHVAVILHRTRIKFRKHLEKEGIYV